MFDIFELWLDVLYTIELKSSWNVNYDKNSLIIYYNSIVGLWCEFNTLFWIDFLEFNSIVLIWIWFIQWSPKYFWNFLVIFLYNWIWMVYKVFINWMELFHSMITLKEKWLWTRIHLTRKSHHSWIWPICWVHIWALIISNSSVRRNFSAT